MELGGPGHWPVWPVVKTALDPWYTLLFYFSSFSQLFDSIVLDRYINYLMSSELQVGFKVKNSTNKCSMDLKESIACYRASNRSIFCTFLDATKAFDRVKYCKLFNLTIQRKLPALHIRVLIFILNLMLVSWPGVASDYFLAVNGVKQNGLLKPVLILSAHR